MSQMQARCLMCSANSRTEPRHFHFFILICSEQGAGQEPTKGWHPNHPNFTPFIHFSKQRSHVLLATGHMALFLINILPSTGSMILSFLPITPHAQPFPSGVMGLGSQQALSCGHSHPCQNYFFSTWSWFSTVAELALFVSSLSWKFCQTSLWLVNSAFPVPTINGTSFFQTLLTFPWVWDGWRVSSPKL